MEIKPIIEKLEIYKAKIGKNRRGTKVDKSRQTEDRKIFEISEQAKQVQRIKQIVDEMPDARPEVQELIDKLAGEIENGTYLEEVSGKDIVDSIIARLSAR